MCKAESSLLAGGRPVQADTLVTKSFESIKQITLNAQDAEFIKITSLM